jgi:hypothetical protein
MPNELKVESFNGMWSVSLSVSARAPDDCLPEAWLRKIAIECNRKFSSHGVHATSANFGASGLIGLHAHFDLEEKARSVETQQIFRNCEKAVKDIIVSIN